MTRKTVTITTADCPERRDFHLDESRADRFAARIRAEGGTAVVGPFKMGAELQAILSKIGVNLKGI